MFARLINPERVSSLKKPLHFQKVPASHIHTHVPLRYFVTGHSAIPRQIMPSQSASRSSKAELSISRPQDRGRMQGIDSGDTRVDTSAHICTCVHVGPTHSTVSRSQIFLPESHLTCCFPPTCGLITAMATQKQEASRSKIHNTPVLLRAGLMGHLPRINGLSFRMENSL